MDIPRPENKKRKRIRQIAIGSGTAVALAIVTIGANTRLHLWFTARTYPGELEAQLANISRLVRAADIAFALIMIATGLAIADGHTGWGALFIAFGLGGALAFLVIEPATARATFGATPIRNRDLRSDL